MNAEIFALDLDSKHGVDGAAALLVWTEECGELPQHLVNSTPNNGTHHLFRGAGIRNSAGKVAPGFDVRGEGGYIVIPPSRLPIGPYRWLDPAAPIPPAPNWLKERLNTKAKEPMGGRVIRKGSRNDRLYRYACLLRGRNLSDADAWAALQARNEDCDPPLDTTELEQVFESAWQHPRGFALTDLGNAERLVAAHGADWKFLPDLGWCRFQGGLWVPDRGRAITQVAGTVARAMLTESVSVDEESRRLKLANWAVKSESKRSLDAMVALASSRSEVVDYSECFDADPMLLACPNGVIDLHTGAMREALREDRLMKSVGVNHDPVASCPRWEQFLRDTFGDDQAMLSFIARAGGYTISGSTAEQVIFIGQGDGANGKSTFIGAIRRVLGDYATVCPPEMLTNRRSGSIPNDVAGLRGMRLAVASETEQGAKIAESFIKTMSGGDAVTARLLYREWFRFVVQAKLWLFTNHKPRISGSDYAIWRRIVLVPFEHTVTKERRDKNLEESLVAEEGSGILNWLIRGCLEWQRQGLAQPPAIIDATRQYRREEDRITAFLRDRVRDAPGFVARKASLFDAYTEWCKDHEEDGVGRRDFHAKLVDEKAFKVVIRDGYECYADVSVSALL